MWYHSGCVMTEKGGCGKKQRSGGKGGEKRGEVGDGDQGMLALKGGTCCGRRRGNVGGRVAMGGSGKQEG